MLADNRREELRDAIYEYVFTEEVDIVYKELSAFAASPRRELLHRPSLPLVCKQLYIESIKLYYKYGTFECADPDAYLWLSSIPTKYRELIQDVRVFGDRHWLLKSGIKAKRKDTAQEFHLSWLRLRLSVHGNVMRDGMLNAWHYYHPEVRIRKRRKREAVTWERPLLEHESSLHVKWRI